MKMNVRWEKWQPGVWHLRGPYTRVAKVHCVQNPYWSSDKISLRYQTYYPGSFGSHSGIGKMYLTLQEAKKEVERRLKLASSLSDK